MYGERVYEDADGNMIEKNKKTRQVDINADVKKVVIMLYSIVNI